MTTTAIISVISFLKKILGFIISWKKDKHDAQLKEEIIEAKNELEDACSNGDLADLISASKKLGEAGK